MNRATHAPPPSREMHDRIGAADRNEVAGRPNDDEGMEHFMIPEHGVNRPGFVGGIGTLHLGVSNVGNV